MVDRRDQREHHPAAVAVGERADEDPAERADQDRDGDHQGDVGLASASPSVPCSRNSGPSGLISAHAQKLTAKPSVATPSMR